MRNDIYHLVTVADGTSDSSAIHGVLADMAQGKLACDLRLLNYYDEVPVSYGTSIANVDQDGIELAVHEHQAVLMKLDKSTLLKSKHFHNGLGVHCYAAYVNVPKKRVVLHNFAYAQIRAERREAVRVRVCNELTARFSYDNVMVEGQVVDISGTGLSISACRVPAIEADQKGIVSFELGGLPLSVTGSFVRARSQGEDGTLCIFRINPDRISETRIGQFIYQRQVEIVQQLKEGFVVE